MIVGYPISIWGTGVDIHLNHPSPARVDAMAAQAVAFYRSLHADFDVSFTELTAVASDATAIPASRLAGCLAVTELMLQEAVPSLAQPLLNLGFRLDGSAASVTVTPEADPFFVETCTR